MKEGIFGNESKEKEAIKKKFKWTGVDEGGKAYNKAGASQVSNSSNERREECDAS